MWTSSIWVVGEGNLVIAFGPPTLEMLPPSLAPAWTPVLIDNTAPVSAPARLVKNLSLSILEQFEVLSF